MQKGQVIELKLRYEKPAMAIEHYELTQAIAGCALKIGFNTSLCVLKDADAQSLYGMLNLAASGFFTPEGCGNYPSDRTGEDEDGICYHTLANAAFTS